MINQLAEQVHKNAIIKGFYEDGKAQNIGERIALIHSEASEALEADRKGRHANLKEFYERQDDIVSSYTKESNNMLDDADFETLFRAKIKDTFEDEMADIIIRCLDMAAFKGIDLEAHIRLKMRYNSLREKMHGKKY